MVSDELNTRRFCYAHVRRQSVKLIGVNLGEEELKDYGVFKTGCAQGRKTFAVKESRSNREVKEKNSLAFTCCGSRNKHFKKRDCQRKNSQREDQIPKRA
ncbi:hypothetical protein TNCV_553271 [Trichonephila clavipes]|nr:hypothetical protein TNCV_553271 [Trichonephila clavipes]